MIDPVRELKVRAERLHHAVRDGHIASLVRMRVLPEFRSAHDDELLAAAPHVRRKHCLATIARETGFQGWSHALDVLCGRASTTDYGDLLYGPRCAAHLNLWFARYDQARPVLDQRGGYLLAYRRHVLLVDRDYIVTLGFDPDDPDFRAIGWDWIRPANRDARRRLYGKLLAQRAA